MLFQHWTVRSCFGDLAHSRASRELLGSRFLLYSFVASAFFLWTIGCKRFPPQQKLLTNSVPHQVIKFGTNAGGLWKIPSKIVTVAFDPVYSARKRFLAVSLESVLRSLSPTCTRRDVTLIFRCRDGYTASLKEADWSLGNPYLAIGDMDRDSGNAWVPINGTEDLGPCYLIWENVPQQAVRQLPWPYQIVSIECWQTDDYFERARPIQATPRILTGFDIFKKRCMSCHTVNDVGGTVGPELNYPTSVVESWRKDLLFKFIKEPTAVRGRSRMPKPADLQDREVDLILSYLSHVSHFKP
jgi:mono/diheme cytochrome c family protein